MAQRICLFSFICLFLLASRSQAAGPSISQSTREVLALQIALEREGFSPGLLDGKPGRKTTVALSEFQRSRGLPATGRLDEVTREQLSIHPEAALLVRQWDASENEFIAGALPKDWNLKSRLPYLGYESRSDYLAEESHTSQEFLRLLNTQTNCETMRCGDKFTFVNCEEPKIRATDRLEINLEEKIIRAYSGSKLVGLFHCSIAKDKAKRPSGSARIATVSNDPVYRFDPKMWPEVKNVSQVLMIKPGPRNPVGLCWMGLSLKGYGIHGTPKPEMIGKTGSHGCFRLANWDAVRLGRMVRVGTVVEFVGNQ